MAPRLAAPSASASDVSISPADVEAWKLGVGHVPRNVERAIAATGAKPLPPLERLALAAQVRARAEQVVVLKVQECRSSGATWQQVGDALGVSMQAAQQRYGKTTR